jgi:hypothetical protein
MVKFKIQNYDKEYIIRQLLLAEVFRTISLAMKTTFSYKIRLLGQKLDF